MYCSMFRDKRNQQNPNRILPYNISSHTKPITYFCGTCYSKENDHNVQKRTDLEYLMPYHQYCKISIAYKNVNKRFFIQKTCIVRCSETKKRTKPETYFTV